MNNKTVAIGVFITLTQRGVARTSLMFPGSRGTLVIAGCQPQNVPVVKGWRSQGPNCRNGSDLSHTPLPVSKTLERQ